MKKKFIFLFLIVSLIFIENINCICGSKGTVNVGILSNNLPNTDVDLQGNPFGFDIELINAIVQILNLKVNYVISNNINQLFSFIQNQTIDLIGISNLAINEIRLGSFGFIQIDATLLLCIPLVFLGPVPSVIKSPETALSDLNSINTVFGSRNGITTIQNITLAASGVPQTRIIDVSSFNTTQQFLNGFGNTPGKYQALYFFTDLASVQHLKAADNNINFLPCVPLAPSVQVLGGGYAFNKSCCGLMIDFQLALNEVISNGTYQNIINQLIKDPRFSNPLVLASLESIKMPIVNASIINGFIPSVCICSEPRDNLTNAILNKYKILL